MTESSVKESMLMNENEFYENILSFSYLFRKLFDPCVTSVWNTVPTITKIHFEKLMLPVRHLGINYVEYEINPAVLLFLMGTEQNGKIISGI